MLSLLVLAALIVALPVTPLGGNSQQAQATAPTPSWWDGDCDVNNHPGSYALGATYNGVKACGPGDAQVVHFYQGAWGELEWQCVELVMRYMYLVYGVAPYGADGKDVVNNYSGLTLTKVTNNGTSVPSPGDIVSMAASTNHPTYGHTAVVTAVNVDANGNGSITTMEQNAHANGSATITVTNKTVGDGVSGWLHSPDMSGTSSPVYGPAIAMNPTTNRALAVAPGPSHSLYAYWQTAVDGQWAGPLGIANGAPNKAYSKPAIAFNPNTGLATVVAQGPDHSLYAYWQTAVDGQWAGPLGLAGGAANKAYSNPAIAYNPVTDAFNVVAQGPSNSLYAYWQTSPNSAWAGPLGLNGGAANTAFSAPALTVSPTGKGAVVAQGPSHSLYGYWQNSVNGAWSGPTGINGGVPNLAYSDPSAAMNDASGLTTAVAQGPSNSLYGYWQAPGWAGPIGINGGAAGVAYSNPSVAMNQSSGKATVVVMGPSNSLRAYWQLAVNGQWGGPIGINGGAASTAYSDPAVAFNPGTNRAVAVAEGPSNSLYAYWQTSVDGQWAGPLGIANGQPGIAF